MSQDSFTVPMVNATYHCYYTPLEPREAPASRLVASAAVGAVAGLLLFLATPLKSQATAVWAAPAVVPLRPHNVAASPLVPQRLSTLRASADTFRGVMSIAEIREMPEAEQFQIVGEQLVALTSQKDSAWATQVALPCAPVPI